MWTLFLRLLACENGGMRGSAMNRGHPYGSSGLPNNSYITEDASLPYITEDGLSVYVTET